MLGGKFCQAVAKRLVALGDLRGQFTDGGTQSLQAHFIQRQMLALFMPAVGEDLVKGGLACPGQKVGADLKIIEVLPKQLLGLLQDVLRRRITRDEAVHIQRQGPLIGGKKFEKIRGAISHEKRAAWMTGASTRVLDRKTFLISGGGRDPPHPPASVPRQTPRASCLSTAGSSLPQRCRPGRAAAAVVLR